MQTANHNYEGRSKASSCSDVTSQGVLVAKSTQYWFQFLESAIEGLSDFNIVGQAFDTSSVIYKALELAPRIVVIDLNAISYDGISLVYRLKALANCRVLVISESVDYHSVFAALEAGADGYCLRSTTENNLRAAIRCIALGGAWLDEEVAYQTLKSLKSSCTCNNGKDCSISQTELQAFNLILNGASANAISKHLSGQFDDIPPYLVQLI